MVEQRCASPELEGRDLEPDARHVWEEDGGAVIDGLRALDVQSYLKGWYATFGFASSGPEFVVNGIPHAPMRRG